MQAKDIMTTSVISVPPEGKTEDAVRLILDHHVSALPVVDANGDLKGLVSEGDLIRRVRESDARAGRGGLNCWTGQAVPPGISSSSKAIGSRM